MRQITLLLAVLLGTSMIVEAQQSAPPVPSSKPDKEPAPPLLKSHRRGIYKNSAGVEVIDATPQSPPLATDDPGVPASGEYELNLTSQVDMAKDYRHFDLLFVDANYGMEPKLFGHALPTQIKLEFPLSAVKDPDYRFNPGIGPAAVGLKFNFYTNDHTGLSVAVYPQIEFIAPGSHAEEKGIAEEGHTFILPLLAKKDYKYLTLVANTSYHRPVHAPDREATGTLGFGIGRALTGHLALMGDVHWESGFDFHRDRLMAADVGLMRRIGRTILYTTVGHSLLSADGSGHTYLGFGLKVSGNFKDLD